jgi:hypothetical protein
MSSFPHWKCTACGRAFETERGLHTHSGKVHKADERVEGKRALTAHKSYPTAGPALSVAGVLQELPGGVVVPLLPGAQAAVAGVPVRQPINTDVHALPKQPEAAPEGRSLSFSEKLFGEFVYKHLSNSAGDALLQAVKHADFRPEDLPDTAAMLKFRVEASTSL